MLIGVQVKMARAAIGWGVRDLAKATGLTANTVSRFENGGGANVRTVSAIQNALEDAGVEFIAENGGGVGVRLKKIPTS